MHFVRTLPEFIDTLEKLKFQFSHSKEAMDLWYRGVSNCNHSLQPRIYREIEVNAGKAAKTESLSFVQGRKKEYSASEYEILSHFIKEASGYLPHLPREDDLIWMEYAQHFGVPTRLLDFSANPLVALYFCCKNGPQKDGAVWVLNEVNFQHWSCHAQFVLRNQGITRRQIIDHIIAKQLKPEAAVSCDDQKVLMDRPVSYIPHHIDQRMAAQSSRFLIWGHDSRSLDAMAGKDHHLDLSSHGKAGLVVNERRFLFQFKIPAASKDSILKQLRIYGMSEKTLFPGLDGIGRYLTAIYRTS